MTMKNAGLAGAIALCGIGLIMIGLGNFVSTPKAMAAAPAVGPGDGEPTIVWMDQSTTADGNFDGNFAASNTTMWRMWSDGKIEARAFAFRSLYGLVCQSSPILEDLNCGGVQTVGDTGWIEIPAPPGGEGYACRSDVNGDRRVDGIDLATLLAQWGDGVSCDPQPTYPCFDLGNLDLPGGVMH